LIQAIPPGGSPLLQLPYFTPKVIKAIEGGDTRTHLTVQEYMEIPADRRKKLTTGAGLLTAQQYQAAMTTAAQLPAFKLEKAFFKVTGERFVTPNSLVQLVIKLRFIPPGSKNVPPVNEKDLEDVQNEKDDEAERFTPLLANAPYFAQDHSPRWHVFLGDGKAGRIAVPPFQYSTFDKPLVTSDGKPTYNVQTIKMQFGAPSQPGNYTFTMHLINDSYLGFDSKSYVTMVVEDASRAEEMQEDGEISEPDEGILFVLFFSLFLAWLTLNRFPHGTDACFEKWSSSQGRRLKRRK
jgi:translocation protein SEC63